MRVGVVQLCSTDDLAENLRVASEMTAEAAERGATFVSLPENFAFMRREGNAFPCAQTLDLDDGEGGGEIVSTLRGLASRHGVWLLGGTFPEIVRDDPGRVFNTSTLIAPVTDVFIVLMGLNW